MRRMYSENELRRLIGSASDEVLQALQNQDLKVKTIEQSEPNWELEVEAILTDGIRNSGLVISSQYTKALIYNNVLYIVCACDISNPTGSNIDITANQGVQFEMTIPESIGSKLYDWDNKDLTEVPVADYSFIDIDYRGGIISHGVGYGEARANLQHSAQNKMFFTNRVSVTTTVQANDRAYIVARTFLILE